MDSEVQRDGRVLDLTDDAWREDRLPYEDVTIPLNKDFHTGLELLEGEEMTEFSFLGELSLQVVFAMMSELPEAEQDNGGSTESVKEQEMKWSDLALQSLHENTPNIGT